jgi:hypothetical protein
MTMKRLFNLVAAIAALCGGANALSAQDWYSESQREQIHEQFLSPVEHDALHRGMNTSYGSSYSSYPPSLPYGSGFGTSTGYGAGYGTSMYPSNYGYGVSNFNSNAYTYGRTRINCGMATPYGTSAYNRGRLW